MTDADDALARELLQELREAKHALNEIWAIARMSASDLLFALQRRDPKHILHAATHQYSQNYEDAIIAEIFSRIGEGSRTFVEVGIETGAECNTRALLERGWRGIWVDANVQALETARVNMRPFIETGALTIVRAMATADNVESIVATIGRPIDFLSVDVDHNTSHLWRAIATPARVACIEYNSEIPPTVEWEVPYDPSATWDRTSYYGASLKMLERIGAEKSMALVGCDFHGVNAFFVARAECGDKFLAPYTAEKHFEPPRFALVGHRGHPAQQKTQ